MSEKNKESYGLSPDAGKRLIEVPKLGNRPPVPANPTRPIGLIGCGGIAGHHLAAYKTAGFNVRALCDLDIDKAKTYRDQHFPEASVFSNFQAVLDFPSIEVVDIATHPVERVPVIEAAIAAGKHILSQKPFAEDLETAGRLVVLAEAGGVKLGVNQNGRWAPHFRWMTEAVRQGLIGEVGMVNFDLHFDHSWTAGTAFDSVDDLILYDFGIHWFDILRCLMPGSVPLRVSARRSFAPGQKPKPPMLAAVIVEFEAALATMTFDGASRTLLQDRTRICGSRGEIISSGPNLSSQEIVFSVEDGQASLTPAGTWFSEGFQGSMAELLLAIDEDRNPENSARDNLSTLALCFAAIESANTGTWVEIPSPG